MSKLTQGLKRMFGGRFRAGSYSAFAAVVVIAIAVLANLMVSTLPSTTTQLDLTEQSLYSLSEQTERIAASLDKDVTMYLICNEGSEDTTILRLLERYEGLSDHIRVETMDPTIHPTFLDQYELDISTLYANSVLLDCGGRYRLVGYDEIYVTEYSMDYYSYSYNSTTSFDGENALTNALHYVSSDSLPKAYILTGHGEAELDESITAMLAQDNFDSESISLLSMDAAPEDAAAIIIHQPTSDLSEDEADLLIAYLENGGSVTLFTSYMDVQKMPQLLRMTSAMGLTAGEGIVIEGDRQMRLNRYPHYLLPEIGDHEITEALSAAGYYILTPLAQPILETEDSTADITWLLTTSDDAYAKLAGLNLTTTEKEEGDAEGPFYVGAVAEDAGKLLWITGDSFLDSYVDSAVSGANSNLFLNALNWMGGQEESISIRAKSLDATGLTVTQSDSSLWSVIMIGVIPLALVAVGVIIMMRRKRR
ncbi:MAG: GldG family protein [Clostridia bacterium]|nr:GldG family protein [Clostridia bacterium]